MVSVFKYSDPSDYLNDLFKEKSRLHPAFSLRSWASQIGFKEHSSLVRILKKNRKISRTQQEMLKKHLKFDESEANYFSLLVEIQRQSDFAKKSLLARQLEQLAPKKGVSFREVEDFRFLSDPLHLQIFEMMSLKSFRWDVRWFHARLGGGVSISEIKAAMKRLIQLGLVKQQGDGQFRKIKQNLTTVNDVESQAVQHYLSKMLQQADKKLADPVEEREFQSYSFSVDRKKMPLAKKLVREFLQNFFEQMQVDDIEADDIFQISLQLFNVTPGEWEDDKN